MQYWSPPSPCPSPFPVGCEGYSLATLMNSSRKVLTSNSPYMSTREIIKRNLLLCHTRSGAEWGSSLTPVFHAGPRSPSLQDANGPDDPTPESATSNNHWQPQFTPRPLKPLSLLCVPIVFFADGCRYWPKCRMIDQGVFFRPVLLLILSRFFFCYVDSGVWTSYVLHVVPRNVPVVCIRYF